MEASDGLLRSLSTWSPDLPVDRRLGVLSDLVAYWHGKRLVESRPVNANIPLPLALSWLYSEITARHTHALKALCPGWVRGDPIMMFNFPRDPRCFEVEDSGKTKFLMEQQGVFRCGTHAEASDGSVFRQESKETTWRQCADRLTDFILWEIVLELTICRTDTLWGDFSPETAAKIVEPMVKVNTGKVSTYGTHQQVHHTNELAVISTPNSQTEMCLAAVARTRAPLEALKKMGRWNVE